MIDPDIRDNPLFRDYEYNEPIWILVDGRSTPIPAFAVEQPNDQSSFTFQADPNYLDYWPLAWGHHCDWWDDDEDEPPDGCDCTVHSYYVMAGSEGLFEEDMCPHGPYPEVYGQMLWTWDYEGIVFTTRPRIVS